MALKRTLAPAPPSVSFTQRGRHMSQKTTVEPAWWLWWFSKAWTWTGSRLSSPNSLWYKLTSNKTECVVDITASSPKVYNSSDFFQSFWSKLWFWREVVEDIPLKPEHFRILHPEIIHKTGQALQRYAMKPGNVRSNIHSYTSKFTGKV